MACNITGKKPSGLNDPVVPVNLDDSWMVIESSDGKVCRIRPSAFAALVNTPFVFVVSGLSGTTINVPLAINGGKLPADGNKVAIYTNGSRDYPVDVVDYNLVYNAGQDQIEFTVARNQDDILVVFTL